MINAETYDGVLKLWRENSENSANDKVRDGRMSLSDHVMVIESLKATRMDYDKAKDYLYWQKFHGFLTQDEYDIVLSICAVHCPSRFD